MLVDHELHCHDRSFQLWRGEWIEAKSHLAYICKANASKHEWHSWTLIPRQLLRGAWQEHRNVQQEGLACCTPVLPAHFENTGICATIIINPDIMVDAFLTGLGRATCINCFTASEASTLAQLIPALFILQVNHNLQAYMLLALDLQGCCWSHAQLLIILAVAWLLLGMPKAWEAISPAWEVRFDVYPDWWLTDIKALICAPALAPGSVAWRNYLQENPHRYCNTNQILGNKKIFGKSWRHWRDLRTPVHVRSQYKWKSTFSPCELHSSLVARLLWKSIARASQISKCSAFADHGYNLRYT